MAALSPEATLLAVFPSTSVPPWHPPAGRSRTSGAASISCSCVAAHVSNLLRGRRGRIARISQQTRRQLHVQSRIPLPKAAPASKARAWARLTPHGLSLGGVIGGAIGGPPGGDKGGARGGGAPAGWHASSGDAHDGHVGYRPKVRPRLQQTR
mmetsp:Transcript_16884/g.49566  ORF Transcript_16884/g.49566 Transcript_16884/m.49566 type:complete len:153 (-) Transcript_16884:152-610(-)